MPDIQIDWQAELERSINLNRLSLLRSLPEKEASIRKVIERSQNQIIIDTQALFNKSNIDGKWNLSKAIKYDRLNKLNISNAEILKQQQIDMNKLIRLDITGTFKDEHIESQRILNDFNLVDSSKFFKVKPDRFIKDMVSQPMMGVDYLKRLKRITVNQAFQIADNINQSILLGEGIQKTVARVKRVSGLTDNAAKRLVSTAIFTASNQAHFDNFARTKSIEKWQWSATLDSRTCPICGVQDQKVFPMSMRSIIPAHFMCRCTPVPYISSRQWKDRGRDNVRKDTGRTRIARDPKTGKNIKLPADTTYRDYFKKLSKAQQENVIGVEKRKLWKAGEIKFRQIAPQRQVVTLKDLETHIASKGRKIKKIKKPAISDTTKKVSEEIESMDRGVSKMINGHRVKYGYYKRDRYTVIETKYGMQRYRTFPNNKTISKYVDNKIKDLDFSPPIITDKRINIVDIRESKYKGTDMRWTEIKTGNSIAESDLLLYHYSDEPIKNFANIETCFFDKSRAYDYTENGYVLKVKKGTKLNHYGDGEEFRVDLTKNMEIFKLKNGWSNYKEVL